MPIFQYKCSKCSAVFEHLVNDNLNSPIGCVSCGSEKYQQIRETQFYPNLLFCSHNQDLSDKSEYLQSQLKVIMTSDAKRCGGCGIDGPSGGCGTGGCGKTGRCTGACRNNRSG